MINRLIKGFSFNESDPYFISIIDQIPRLISLMDRNPGSRSYGCFDRTYWLDKAIDFPSANIQYNVLALAYLHNYDFNGSKYYKNIQLLSWIEAAMLFWSKIQHNDGSFDEFYPNERGWGAPTGFTCYAMGVSLALLDNKLSSDCVKKVTKSLNKGIKFLNNYDGDKMLTNHHAMTILAINTVASVIGNNKLLFDLDNKINILISLHNEEGWSKEYDGPDLGYLSATVSFLSKSQLINHDKRIQRVIDESINFITYFAQPDGGFGGIISSRNTVHVYPDGFEINKLNNLKSHSLCRHFEKSLTKGNLAIPIRMADRYLGYRIVEFIETAINRNVFAVGNKDSVPLPFEKSNFTKIYKNAGIIIKKVDNYYIIINLAKGGVFKIFDIDREISICNDAGITLINNGYTLTSSWIDSHYNIKIENDIYSVNGHLVQVVNPYQFTLGMVLFRLIQITLGRISVFAYYMKILIKKLFISGINRSKIKFSRQITFEGKKLLVTDIIKAKKHFNVKNIIIGGDFHFRYVPQSRYFLESEHSVSHTDINSNNVGKIFSAEGLIHKREFNLFSNK